jgi:hypothetical protein
MFLFKRETGSMGGWEFVSYVENAPQELTSTTHEYCYFFISTEV